MTDIPGHCSHCGALFTNSRIFSFNNSRGVRLDRTQTACPRCDRDAFLVDGNFDFVDGKIVVNEAPLRSILIIAAILAGRQIEDGRVDERELFAPLQGVPEQLREMLIATFRAQGLVKYAGAIMIALSIAIANTHTNGTVDWNILFDQVRTAITHEAPYPGLTHAPHAEAVPKPEHTEENGSTKPSVAEPSVAPKSEPAPSKRKQRRLRGQAKMLQKQTSKSPSPKKKC